MPSPLLGGATADDCLHEESPAVGDIVSVAGGMVGAAALLRHPPVQIIPIGSERAIRMSDFLQLPRARAGGVVFVKRAVPREIGSAVHQSAGVVIGDGGYVKLW